MIRLALSAALLAALSPAYGQLTRKAPPEIDDALRARVSSFYTHFQRGEFRQAEEYVAEASKDVFYGAKKNRIINFEIRTVEYAEDFRSANVLVACETMVPMLGSEPLAVPLASDWRYSEEGWFMHLKDPGEDRSRVAVAGSPFGQMQFSQDLPQPGRLSDQQAKVKPPSIESLAGMVHVNPTDVKFIGGGKVTRIVQIENRSPGKMTVEIVSSPIRGLTATLDQTEVESGRTGTLTLSYDPAVNALKGRRRVDLLLMPISQTIPVFLDF